MADGDTIVGKIAGQPDVAAPDPTAAAPAADGTSGTSGTSGTAPPADGGTILDDKGTGKPLVEREGFPDNWRALLAGEDKGVMKTLERLSSPKALLDSYREAQKKLSEKQTTLTPPGEDATPEQVKAWRDANGIPESPDKYEIKLRDNRVLGEADKPLFDDFAKVAHEAGFNTAQVSRVLDWWMDVNEGQTSGTMDRDRTDHDTGRQALRDEWGGADFERNVNAITGLFGTSSVMVPGEDGAEMDVANAMLKARMPNGRLIGNDPAMIKFLAQLGHDLVPMDSQIPPGSTEGSATVRLEEIRAFRRKDFASYESDKKMQAEERDLIAIEERQKARRGRAA
tara:strand:+ start:5189 stop:6208 length:1020 start_codon:yes stop_codon:yes gene_type:complete